MTYWLRHWIPNPGVPCSNSLGGSKVDSALHPSEVDKVLPFFGFWLFFHLYKPFIFRLYKPLYVTD